MSSTRLLTVFHRKAIIILKSGKKLKKVTETDIKDAINLILKFCEKGGSKWKIIF